MATFKILLYKSKKLASGAHPVMIQVIHHKRVKRLSLGYSCSLNEWDEGRCRFRKNHENYMVKNRVLSDLESRASYIIESLRAEGKPFTFDVFVRKFRGELKNITLWALFEELMTELNEAGRTGNYYVYKDALNALKRYRRDKSVMVQEVNYAFLNGFEVFLRKTGCSNGGIYVYMRTLRAAINQAINRDYMEEESYPFATAQRKKGRYSLAGLKSDHNPRAIPLSEMEKFKLVDLGAHPHLVEAHVYFLFMYLNRGMNFTDMAYLKPENVEGGRIIYKRKKTGRSLSIRITKEIADILAFFEGKGRGYLLPILDEAKHKTERQRRYRIKRCLRKLNGDLKEIAKIAGIEIKITSYTARHQYAQTLKEKGVEEHIISQNLGHKTVETTLHYLSKLGDAVGDEADKVL